MYLAIALTGTALVWISALPDLPESTWPLWLATGGFWALSLLGKGLTRWRRKGR